MASPRQRGMPAASRSEVTCSRHAPDLSRTVNTTPSRRVRGIRRARPALSATGLRSLYPGSAVLGGRLATLTAAGYARQVGGRHVLTGKGRGVSSSLV